MRILPPVHNRRPFDNHAKQAPEVFASRWKTAMPPSSFPTLSSSEAIHEKTEKLLADPFQHLASMLESDNAMHAQQQAQTEEIKNEEGEMQLPPTGSSLLSDSGRRSDLRALGYSDKIVEKLTPYQVHWLHHYHIYNHADEILHCNHSVDAAEFFVHTSPSTGC